MTWGGNSQNPFDPTVDVYVFIHTEGNTNVCFES